MSIKSFIVLALTLALVHSDYNLVIRCGSFSTCPLGCSQCQIIDGGPFNQMTICATSGCTAGNTFNVSFVCNGCSNGKDCSYYVTGSSSPQLGCTNYFDPKWEIYKTMFDNLYYIHTLSSAPYDWCGNACSSSLSAGVIVVIVLAVLAVVGLIGFLIFKNIKKRNQASNLTGERITDPGLYDSIKNSG